MKYSLGSILSNSDDIMIIFSMDFNRPAAFAKYQWKGTCNGIFLQEFFERAVVKNLLHHCRTVPQIGQVIAHFCSGRSGRGPVRHSYTISALVVSICSKLRFIKCRYGSTDCPARDVKYGGDMGHGKSGR